jgi:DNA-binding CsgD family transcriptional regulator/pimeloyl-ACP methyl ester carboxylesterase
MSPIMVLPKVRYADGERIAFHVLGKGPAVAILFPYHVNHLTLNWQVPLHRGAFEYLARYFSVINPDFRGAGISERFVKSLSLDTFVDDMQRVLTCLGIKRIAVCALGDAALIASYFALRGPDRVTSMVFIAAGESETNRRVLSLRHTNPSLEARLRGALLGGLADERNASALAAVAQEALSSDSLKLWEKVLLENRLSKVVSRVRVPVLWLHASTDELVKTRHVRALVKRMRQAKLMIVPGRSGMDIWRDRAAMRAMTLFIAKGFGTELEVATAQRRRHPKTATYPAGLSQREVDVLRFTAAGRTNQQISEDLFISLNTVSYHLRSIFNKTGAANRTEAASFAHRHGLSTDPR